MLLLYLSMVEGLDQKALFLQLYGRNKKKVYGYAVRKLGSGWDAEDAAQHVWMQTAQYFDRINLLSPEEQTGYLMTMVRNHVARIKQSGGKEISLEETFRQFTAPEQEDGTGYEYLVNLIRGLPEPYRAVLELRLVLEYSTRETAQALGIAESTVTTRLQRGRALLWQKLKEEGYAP